jgi:nitroreductase
MPDVDATALLALLASCRSVRRFADRPVEAELIDRIVEAARWTGSARNRQPWRFVVVEDRAVRRELSTLGLYAQHLAGAPVVLVLLSADDGRRDTAFDLGRVAQSLGLAAHALGLGSCLATLFPDDNVAEAGRLLGVEAGWVAHHALSLGWPEAAPPDGDAGGRSAIPTGRLGVAELLTRLEP